MCIFFFFTINPKLREFDWRSNLNQNQVKKIKEQIQNVE